MIQSAADAAARTEEFDRGVVKVCAWCKREMTHDDTWIAGVSDARFRANLSHGICPTCLTRAIEAIDRSRNPELP